MSMTFCSRSDAAMHDGKMMSDKARSGIPQRFFLGALALLLIGAAFSLLGGNASVDRTALLDALFHRQEADATAVLILYRVRIPRLLAGVVCGAALSVSGLLMQEALRNPIASPAVLGLHNGAGLFALAAAVLLGPVTLDAVWRPFWERPAPWP